MENENLKQRPILFRALMVKATLEGRKTKTRRLVKPQPTIMPLPDYEVDANINWNGVVWHENGQVPEVMINSCPYGRPGDVLWVRETFTETYANMYFFKASEELPSGAVWKPSIYMPKKAARIWLEIVSVSVERLQDISEDDAWKEGCEKGQRWANELGYFPKEETLTDGSIIGWECAKDWFADLWVSINGEKSWSANPWVWVVEFKRIDKPNT